MSKSMTFTFLCGAFCLLGASQALAEKSAPVTRKEAPAEAETSGKEGSSKGDEAKAEGKDGDGKAAKAEDGKTKATDGKDGESKAAKAKGSDAKAAGQDGASKAAPAKPAEAALEEAATPANDGKSEATEARPAPTVAPADPPAAAAPVDGAAQGDAAKAASVPADSGAKPEAEAAAEPTPPEPPKGTATFVHLLAPDSLPGDALKVQQSLEKADQGRDELHLVATDLTALPADLQAALSEGCRVSACRTAVLSGLGLKQGLIAEMNSSGSALVLTLFDATGQTQGRAEASCVDCDEQEAKRHDVVAQMLADVVASKPKQERMVANGSGPLMRGRRAPRRPSTVQRGVKVWAPSVWTYGASGGLAIAGVGLFIATGSAHSAYVSAINEGRGAGEIESIADAGKTRELMAYTSIVLSAGALATSYFLEREERR